MHLFKKETISPEIFIYFFNNSNPNLIQTQILTLKLKTQTLTQIQVSSFKKVNEKCSFSFYSLQLQNFR